MTDLHSDVHGLLGVDIFKEKAGSLIDIMVMIFRVMRLTKWCHEIGHTVISK